MVSTHLKYIYMHIQELSESFYVHFCSMPRYVCTVQYVLRRGLSVCHLQHTFGMTGYNL